MMHIFFVTLLKKLPATTMSIMSPVSCFKAAHNQLTRITIPTQEQVSKDNNLNILEPFGGS